MFDQLFADYYSSFTMGLLTSLVMLYVILKYGSSPIRIVGLMMAIMFTISSGVLSILASQIFDSLSACTSLFNLAHAVAGMAFICQNVILCYRIYLFKHNLHISAKIVIVSILSVSVIMYWVNLFTSVIYFDSTSFQCSKTMGPVDVATDCIYVINQLVITSFIGFIYYSHYDQPRRLPLRQKVKIIMNSREFSTFVIGLLTIVGGLIRAAGSTQNIFSMDQFFSFVTCFVCFESLSPEFLSIELPKIPEEEKIRSFGHDHHVNKSSRSIPKYVSRTLAQQKQTPVPKLSRPSSVGDYYSRYDPTGGSHSAPSFYSASNYRSTFHTNAEEKDDEDETLAIQPQTTLVSATYPAPASKKIYSVFSEIPNRWTAIEKSIDKQLSPI